MTLTDHPGTVGYLRRKPPFTLPPAAGEQNRKGRADRRQMFVDRRFLVSAKLKVPFHRRRLKAQKLGEFQIMVELGNVIAEGRDEMIVEKPIEFFTVAPVKTDTMRRSRPAADQAALQVAL